MVTANYADGELSFVGSVSHPVHDRFAHYEDAIAVIDISPLLQHFRPWRWQNSTVSLWIVKDVCGVICTLLTWLLLVFAEFVMWTCILLPSKDRSHSFVHGVIFQGFTCLAAFSHLRAMFTNPGAIPRGNATKENIAVHSSSSPNGQVIYRCPKCNSIKPNRAHHCSVCRRCIRKMDHHCPWINNCVGESNQKFFILFTMYICVISIHAFYLTIRHLVICSGSEQKGDVFIDFACDCPVETTSALTTVLMVLLLFESILFSIFTGIMFGSQLWSVWTDMTGIEHVKRESHLWHRKSGWQSVKSVFGHQFSYRWFLPFHSAQSVTKSHETYDYDYSV